jgi:hypothetical protein
VSHGVKRAFLLIQGCVPPSLYDSPSHRLADVTVRSDVLEKQLEASDNDRSESMESVE